MKNIKELRQAIKRGAALYWNDPDPIPGNDYRITDIEDVSHPYFTTDTAIRIAYGEDNSYAEALVSEITELS